MLRKCENRFSERLIHFWHLSSVQHQIGIFIYTFLCIRARNGHRMSLHIFIICEFSKENEREKITSKHTKRGMNNFIRGIELHIHQKEYSLNRRTKQFETIHSLAIRLREMVRYFVYKNLLLFAFVLKHFFSVSCRLSSVDVALCHFVTSRDDYFF